MSWRCEDSSASTALLLGAVKIQVQERHSVSLSIHQLQEQLGTVARPKSRRQVHGRKSPRKVVHKQVEEIKERRRLSPSDIEDLKRVSVKRLVHPISPNEVYQQQRHVESVKDQMMQEEGKAKLENVLVASVNKLQSRKRRHNKMGTTGVEKIRSSAEISTDAADDSSEVESCVHDLTTAGSTIHSTIQKVFDSFVEPNGGLSVFDFAQALCKILRFTDLQMASLLFRPFNTSKSGLVSLTEFADGIKLMRQGNDYEKIQLLFDLFDSSGSGEINSKSFYEALKTRTGNMWDQVLFAQQLVTLVDRNGDGTLEFKEFYETCNEVPVFFRCLVGDLPLYLSSQNRGLLMIDFSMKGMCKLWSKGVHTSHDHSSYGSMDFQGFKPIVEEMFRLKNTNDLDQLLSKQVFSIFDRNNSGSIEFNEFMRGVSELFYGSIRKRAAFIHEIFDIDRDGTASSVEIRKVLNARRRQMHHSISDANRVAINDIMHVLEEKGEAELTSDQFVSAIMKNQSVFNDLERILFLGTE